MSKVIATAIASLIAGGLMFGSALTSAQPTPPTPPTPPSHPTKGVRVTVHDGQVEIQGIDEFINAQINSALAGLNNPNIPPEVREKLRNHLEKVRQKALKKVIKIKVGDMDKVGEELGQLGEDIGHEMEDFAKEMEKWSKDFEKKQGKQIAKQLKWQKHMHSDDDDDDDVGPVDPYEADDMPDMSDLKSSGLGLKPEQRNKLSQMRKDSDAKVEQAKQQLEQASEKLRQQLDNPNTSRAEIEASIDNITRLEGQIRKARILTWVEARNMLDGKQRDKIEKLKHK